MLIPEREMEKAIFALSAYDRLSLDTETTGLRPYKDSELFSIAIASRYREYYFDFNGTLPRSKLELFRPLFADKKITWYLANAKFDMAMLARENLFLAGEIHDVLAIERVLKNDEISYSLEAVAKRYGETKSNAVEEYIKEHGLWTKSTIPGKQTSERNKEYARVPLEIIRPYAEQDARITFNIGKSQEEAEKGLKHEAIPGLPTISRVCANERNLTKTVFHMERIGVRVDRDYCARAIAYEQSRMEREISAFKTATGCNYKASPKLFALIFEDQKENWSYTEKKNPSFDTEALKNFKGDAAKAVLGIRDAKSKLDFYHGFIHHSDKYGVIHPSFNQGGTASGRFSSSDPNFQNLISEGVLLCRSCGKEFEESDITQCTSCKSTELERPEFLLRRGLIPRQGFIFIMPDYSAMEYRLMLDYACNIVGYETPLTKEVKSGKDVHQATADLVTASGFQLDRSRAKNGNFATLYGSGVATLAKIIGTDEAGARRVKTEIFKAAPEIQRFIQSAMKCAAQRGAVFNWLGRRAYFPNSAFAYRAPNYLIQGGCADIMKVAMNEVHAYLENRKSRMLMTIHDELVVEVHESDIATVPREVHRIMETVYKPEYIGMEVSMEWSDKSLADKKKGFPV